MLDKPKFALKKVKKIWKKNSYVVSPEFQGSRRMSWIGFMQAVQELEIEIAEKLKKPSSKNAKQAEKNLKKMGHTEVRINSIMLSDKQVKEQVRNLRKHIKKDTEE